MSPPTTYVCHDCGARTEGHSIGLGSGARCRHCGGNRLEAARPPEQVRIRLQQRPLPMMGGAR